jgi:hypothetical protein
MTPIASRWHFAVNGLAGDEADGSSHAVKVFTVLTVVEGTQKARKPGSSHPRTGSSNPSPSSGESGANSAPLCSIGSRKAPRPLKMSGRANRESQWAAKK